MNRGAKEVILVRKLLNFALVGLTAVMAMAIIGWFFLPYNGEYLLNPIADGVDGAARLSQQFAAIVAQLTYTLVSWAAHLVILTVFGASIMIVIGAGLKGIAYWVPLAMARSNTWCAWLRLRLRGRGQDSSQTPV